MSIKEYTNKKYINYNILNVKFSSPNLNGKRTCVRYVPTISDTDKAVSSKSNSLDLDGREYKNIMSMSTRRTEFRNPKEEEFVVVLDSTSSDVSKRVRDRVASAKKMVHPSTDFKDLWGCHENEETDEFQSAVKCLLEYYEGNISNGLAEKVDREVTACSISLSDSDIDLFILKLIHEYNEYSFCELTRYHIRKRLALFVSGDMENVRYLFNQSEEDIENLVDEYSISAIQQKLFDNDLLYSTKK